MEHNYQSLHENQIFMGGAPKIDIKPIQKEALIKLFVK
jgi:hypothetical protein